MSEWKSYKLGDVLEIRYGKDHKTLSEGTIPAYGSGGIMRYVDKPIFSDVSILIPRKGTLNNIIYKDEPFWTVDTMFWSKINQLIAYPKFLFYQLSTIDYNNLNVGSAVPSLTVPVINEIEIKLPELNEQIQIAEVLSSLDDKIDLLKRQDKTLEALAETLFRQWFIEESDESWEIKKISDFIDVRDGTHDSPKQKQNGHFLITTKHIKQEGIDFSNAYKISEEDFFNINKRSKVSINDILFSMIGTLGLIYYVNENPNYAIKNIGLFRTSEKPEFAKFLYLLLKSPLGTQFIHESADGSTQEYISLSSLRNLTFPYPGKDKIIEFDNIITPYFEKIFTNKTQIRTLTQLRDTLLPKLMSGEVRVEG